MHSRPQFCSHLSRSPHCTVLANVLCYSKLVRLLCCDKASFLKLSYSLESNFDINDFIVTGADTEASNCSDGELRLSGAALTNQGRLEVCVNGAWGSVCDSQGVFTTDEAKVACRQLGILQVEGEYGTYVEWKMYVLHFYLDEVGVLNASVFRNPNGPLLMDRIHCDGSETNFLSCDYSLVPTCSHVHDIAIICHRKLYVKESPLHRFL